MLIKKMEKMKNKTMLENCHKRNKNGMLWHNLILAIPIFFISIFFGCESNTRHTYINPAPPSPIGSINYYYVSTTGNDVTGDGSFDNPWGSWQKGVLSIGPGDTLYIRGGTYMPSSTYGNGCYCRLYISGKSGTAGSPITIQNYPARHLF